ncbi:MAG: HAMP domain-containing protein [Chloroflexi bacterium]|nr:MAG: HAMP domain-containing protein [Chloroflexota bacterium]
MNRLWIRVSLAISAYTLVLMVCIVGLFIVGAVLRPEKFRSERNNNGPFSEELDGPPPLKAIPAGVVWVTTLVGLFGLGAGVLVSRGISRPISDLADGVKKVGAGKLGYRVETRATSREIIALNEAFNQMSADLQQAEQLRSNLMADVSHELRTPLTVLEGNLRAAIDNIVELDEDELANLYRQTHHLIRLVNDLRDVSLAEANQLPLQVEEIDVAELVREVVWNWELAAKESGVELTAVSPPSPTHLTADPGRLRQLLSNLIANSLAHTPTNGKITVTFTNKQNTLSIAVADTGSGIAQEQLPHVFDRFYRADKSRSRETGGTGLGLAIVKGIVEAHGGEVTAVSPGPGKGSTFTIQFPYKRNRPDILTL